MMIMSNLQAELAQYSVVDFVQQMFNSILFSDLQ